MNKAKNVVNVVLLSLLLFGFSTWCIFKPATAVSESERRPLAQMPKWKVQSLVDGSFMKGFESYATDQFPLRDEFRRLKAVFTYSVYRQKDMNGIYVADGYASKLEYPMDKDSLDNVVKKFKRIQEKYLTEESNRVYYSVIPDKNYFLAAQNGYPAMDYEEVIDYFREQVDDATGFQYIDIFDSLEIGDYYQTDTHWRQEKIVKVAEKLSAGMDNPIKVQYQTEKLNKPFYGVYYGQSALPLPSETIYYLRSEGFASMEIFDFEINKTMDMYDMTKAQGKDPYEMFLSGSKSLIRIKNPKATSGKKLIMFRDSFGSSIAPLLADGYEEILLVDIRYLSSEMLGKLIDFEDSDVLFLYSTLVLNNSVTLK